MKMFMKKTVLIMTRTTFTMCLFLISSSWLFVAVPMISPIHAATADTDSRLDDSTIQVDSSTGRTEYDTIDKDRQDGIQSVVVSPDGATAASCAAVADHDDACPKDHGRTSSIVQHEQQKQHQQQQQHSAHSGPSNETSKHQSFFPDCRLYLARSTLALKKSDLSSNIISSSSGHRRLGLYTVQPISRGHPIGASDILIQLIDYPEESPLSSFVSLYSFESSQFGAQYEAKRVASILAGIASVAQSTVMGESNAVPFYARDMDEADVPRTVEPGAGALTHYHNLTFLAAKNLSAGSEIFVGIPYSGSSGSGGGGDNQWSQSRMERIRQRDELLQMEDGSEFPDDGVVHRGRRDVKWIQEHGICVDHLMVQKSRKKGVGRGAFAVRNIPKGSIVSASPLVPIDQKAAVSVTAVKQGGKARIREQLLVNYCLGHVNSSVLFYPTAPVVNLINHDREKTNVELRWSTSEDIVANDLNVSAISLEDVVSKFYDSDALVMEFVATRDIRANEEIFMDYGLAWSLAWDKHVQEWNPPPNAMAYAPSYVMDDVTGLLRTEKEQVDHPYPSNVMTACFYRYSTHQRNDGIASSNQASSGETTAVQWKMDRRTFDYRNLRPCQVVKREDIDGKFYYTAIMKNWNGMKKDEMIPKHEIHIVNSIPRHAVRFVDKLYSTDMHLSNAFRHEIQIPDDIFPCAWMDLDNNKICGEIKQYV